MNIGKALKLCRTQKGMSKTALAELSGLSISYLTLLEQDKRDPNLSTVEKLSKALNIPSSVLLFLASEPGEIEAISLELAEKMSFVALQLMSGNSNGKTALPT